MKLLLVEDEFDLSQILAKGLKKSGYAVDAAYDGGEALNYYQLYEYDLIILDLNLPVISGLSVLRQIRRENNKIKILILSARTKIEQRVEGLDAGANDYLVKPFNFMELEARIRALLRISFTQKSSLLSCGELTVNTITKAVTFAGTPLKLTKKEYAILEYLFLHKNELISSETLIEHIWDSDADLYLNSLKYHMYSIKKKLSAIDSSRQYIRNVWGRGYQLSEENENEESGLP